MDTRAQTEKEPQQGICCGSFSLSINCFAIAKQRKVFARLFQKAAGLRGGALIAARRLRNFCPKERRRGEKQSSGLFFGGEPSPGVPHSLTPSVHIAK